MARVDDETYDILRMWKEEAEELEDDNLPEEIRNLFDIEED